MNWRRLFLGSALLAAAIAAAPESLVAPPAAAEPKPKVRVTLIRWPYT